MTCKDCIHFDVCDYHITELTPMTVAECQHFKSKADYAEVKHGEWHIMPEDPYDESECPTEKGWYRIITIDGEEMTDYFFNKPTMTGRGCVYWKKCRKGIRAWAKMDGKERDNNEQL